MSRKTERAWDFCDKEEAIGEEDGAGEGSGKQGQGDHRRNPQKETGHQVTIESDPEDRIRDAQDLGAGGVENIFTTRLLELTNLRHPGDMRWEPAVIDPGKIEGDPKTNQGEEENEGR